MSISDIGRAAIGIDHGWLSPALLLLCLAVIAVLATVIVQQRRLIGRKNEYIVRYVGQYLSLKYDEFPELHKSDTTYVFSFVPTDDMFYVSFGDNGSEQERLETCFITKNHAGKGDYVTVRLAIPTGEVGRAGASLSRRANLLRIKTTIWKRRRYIR